MEVATLHRYSDTHYLPAARSGIMQSHRVIASSLVERSTRGGLEHFLELPTFSGVMADFLQKLILFEEAQGNQNSVGEAAEALERGALAGQIKATRSQVGGYPEFAYRPSGMGEDIRLTRASSMVSELAPVVLFLRGAVSPGDMLIIEEPEAHLHPAAQTQMARTLASLVRAGVRVVVTTHSDWLLMEIANLMREGELQEISEKQVRSIEPGRVRSCPAMLASGCSERMTNLRARRLRRYRLTGLKGLSRRNTKALQKRSITGQRLCRTSSRN